MVGTRVRRREMRNMDEGQRQRKKPTGLLVQIKRTGNAKRRRTRNRRVSAPIGGRGRILTKGR